MNAAILDLVQAGDQQLAELEAKIADLDEQLTRLDAELTTLATRRDTSAETLRDQRQKLLDLESISEQAIAYAKLSLSTQLEHKASKDAATSRKAFQTAQKALDNLEREAKEEDSQDAKREEEIAAQLRLLQFEKHTREGELRSVQAGRNKAHDELGADLYADFLSNYATLESQIEQLRGQLVEALTDQQILHEQACRDMAAWPPLQREVARLRIQDDAIVQALEATRMYAETMYDIIPEMPDDLPDAIKRRGFSLWDAVLLHPDKITLRKRQPQILQKHIDGCQQLLAQYQDYLSTKQI